MSTQHTPGPWEWTNKYQASEGRETWSLIGQDGYGILSCDGDENSPQNRGQKGKVDARLIAAAPDLLNALTVLADACERMGVPAQAARAAIAKARGQA
jgi:hypothetical protein